MSKFSIICPESSTVEVDGKIYPCVILIGRDEHLNRVKLRQKCFPYFYLTEKDFRIVSKSATYNSWHVHKVEDTPVRDINGRLLKKIFVSDCDRIGESVEGINKMARVNARAKGEMNHRVYTYESDLSKNELLPLRFLIDNGIKSGCNVENGKVTGPCDFQAPLRVWIIDFEAYVFKEYTTGLSPKDPLYMVSIWDSYEKALYTLYVNNPKWDVEKQTTNFLKAFTKFPHKIIKYDTEAQMLDALVDLVIQKDPDLFTAWNLNRYDYPKWKQRMDLLRSNCLHKFCDISPMKCILHSRTLRVKGRIGFDEMVAYKQFTDQEMDEYSLAYVSEYEELGYKKIPFVGTSGHCWDVAPEIAFKRNVYDVLIIKALEDKYALIDCYDDLRTEFGALFQHTFVRHMNIDSALMRMVNGKIALRTVSGESPPEEKLLGALVVAPEPDEYVNVFQFDFGREYPSLIRGLNISPETYSDHEISNSYHVVYDWVNDEGIKKHFEAWFDKSKVGLLPHLISFFFAKRDEYDKALKKAIADNKSEGEIRRYERRQYNMKKTTNAIYGVMDYPRFRLHNPECTQATAIMGRISIEEEKKFLTEIGYTLLYGDTDSFFVCAHSNDKEALLIEGKELQRKLNEHLSEFLIEKYGVSKAPAELGFKKIYSKIMFIAKKNYAGRSIWDEKKGWKDELDIKGISSVRSDASMLEKSTVKELVKLVLNDAKKETIEEFIKITLKSFDDRKYGLIELSYPAQIKKRISKNVKGEWICDYKTTLPAHIKSAIYSNLYLNTDFGEGDKPRRISIKIPKKIRVKKGQQPLFITTPEPYPTEFMVNGKLRQLTDISIVTDMMVPLYFQQHVDYERIKKRLEGKINKILEIHYKVEK
jgi:DNA polymerase I